ncbi:Queuosine salvage protein family [Trypanosoma melophagium]|uniref:Queuosine salvage protein family n=1 Tax=Trypanosoma melophagium TaxID=715481 RepID=UPI00351AA08D|nr:Queuosine salvage protein family [Trypanosoma melophagium]
MKGETVKSFLQDPIRQDVRSCVSPYVSVKNVTECVEQPHFKKLLDIYLNEFHKETITSSHWLPAVPVNLRGDLEEVVNYLGMLIAIDFRHWGERGANDKGGETQTPVGSRVVDFCGFYATMPLGEKDPHAEKDVGVGGGRLLRGSAAMVYLLRRAVEEAGVYWHRPEVLLRQELNKNENEKKEENEEKEALLCYCFRGHAGDEAETPMWMPATQTRMRILMDIARELQKRGDSFYDIWCRSQGYLYHPNTPSRGFLAQLVNLHPRYKDVCVVRRENTNNSETVVEVPVLKLAQLTALAIDDVMTHMRDFIEYTPEYDFSIPTLGAFHDRDKLTICCDYQIPKALRLLGIIEYNTHLAYLVDEGILLAPGGVEESSIRVAALVASEILLECLRRNVRTVEGEEYRSVKWDSPMVDHLLWWIGRHHADPSIRHHLCSTIMY